MKTRSTFTICFVLLVLASVVAFPGDSESMLSDDKNVSHNFANWARLWQIDVMDNMFFHICYEKPLSYGVRKIVERWQQERLVDIINFESFEWQILNTIGVNPWTLHLILSQVDVSFDEYWEALCLANRIVFDSFDKPLSIVETEIILAKITHALALKSSVPPIINDQVLWVDRPFNTITQFMPTSYPGMGRLFEGTITITGDIILDGDLYQITDSYDSLYVIASGNTVEIKCSYFRYGNLALECKSKNVDSFGMDEYQFSVTFDGEVTWYGEKRAVNSTATIVCKVMPEIQMERGEDGNVTIVPEVNIILTRGTFGITSNDKPPFIDFAVYINGDEYLTTAYLEGRDPAIYSWSISRRVFIPSGVETNIEFILPEGILAVWPILFAGLSDGDKPPESFLIAQ